MRRRQDVDELFMRKGLVAPRSSAITVAVSLYNYEQFIEECLGSVAAQTHEAIELIVVDDASKRDESAERCRAWLEREAPRFDRVLFLRHRHNLGLADTRNTAFAAARTEYVFVLDADNTIYPRALRRLWNAASVSRSEAAYSQIELYGDEIGLGSADIWSRDRMRLGNYIDAMALIRRSTWRDVQGYSHIEGGWEDFDFWCKLFDRGMEALFVPEVLCRYRVHGASMSRTDTTTSHDRLKVELTIRHPWLELN